MKHEYTESISKVSRSAARRVSTGGNGGAREHLNKDTTLKHP